MIASHPLKPDSPMNAPMTSSQRILIIDDDRDFAESLGEVFESLGHQTAFASNREEVRQGLLSYRPDMAIIDVRLGQEDGIEVIPIVRRALPDALCIVVTAFADMDIAVRALRAGAYDFLHKPLRMPELTMLLQHSLARIRLQRERKEALERLEENEQRLRNLVEGSLQGIMVIERGRPVFANPTMAGIFGYESLDELLELGAVEELFNAKDRARVAGLIDNVLTDSAFMISMQVFQGQRKDGRPIWLEASLRHVRWGSAEAVQAVMVDISERRRFEEERNRLAAAVEQSADCIFITDVEGGIIYVNSAFERITGYSMAEAIGAKPENLGIRNNNLKAEHAERDPADGADQWREQARHLRKDGGEYHCDSATAVLREPDGTIVGFVEVQRDTTEQENLQEQLRHAQKMEAIGILAGGIAHDFNNLLTPILGFTDLTRDSFAPDDQAYKDLTIVYDSAKRAKDLVEQILVFSRKREPRRGVLDLGAIAQSALLLLRATLPKGVEVRERLPDMPLLMIGDGSLCQQVLMNLCVNAHQAMSGNGTLTIVVEPIELAGHVTRLGETISGMFARMQVEDCGHGMDAATLNRIFEPFFTTKKDKAGTGLGLSIVFGIVQSHQGFIDVHSELGRGSRFDIYFPLAAQSFAEVVPGAEAALSSSGGTVLFVDDELANCELGKRVLESAGYFVCTETSSRQALKSILEARGKFDVLITDEAMPELSGHELVRLVRQAGSSIPAIVLSGYQDAVTPEIERTLEIAKTMTKPYSHNELLSAVESILKPGAKDWQGE